MKISSASKKVLASALSAAMVVAFAPTVAFGAVAVNDTVKVEFDTTGLSVADGTSGFAKDSYDVKVTEANKVSIADIAGIANYKFDSKTAVDHWYLDVDEDGTESDGDIIATGGVLDFTVINNQSKVVPGATLKLKPAKAAAQVAVSGLETVKQEYAAAGDEITLEYTNSTAIANAVRVTVYKGEGDSQEKLASKLVDSLAKADTATQLAKFEFQADDGNATDKIKVGKWGEGKYTVKVYDVAADKDVATKEYNVVKVKASGVFDKALGTTADKPSTDSDKTKSGQEFLAVAGQTLASQLNAAAQELDVRAAKATESDTYLQCVAYTAGGKTAAKYASDTWTNATPTAVKVASGMELSPVYSDAVAIESLDFVQATGSGNDVITATIAYAADDTDYKLELTGAKAIEKKGSELTGAVTLVDFGTAGAKAGTYTLTVTKVEGKGTNQEKSTVVATKDITLTEVTFDAGDHGKIGSKATKTVIADSTKKLSASYQTVTAAEGYRFVGWSTDGATCLTGSEKVGATAVTLKAVYAQDAVAAPTFSYADGKLTLATDAGSDYEVRYVIGTKINSANIDSDKVYTGPITLDVAKSGNAVVSVYTHYKGTDTAAKGDSAIDYIYSYQSADYGTAAPVNAVKAFAEAVTGVQTAASTVAKPQYYSEVLKTASADAQAAIKALNYGTKADWNKAIANQEAVVLKLVAEYENAQIDALVAGVTAEDGSMKVADSSVAEKQKKAIADVLIDFGYATDYKADGVQPDTSTVPAGTYDDANAAYAKAIAKASKAVADSAVTYAKADVDAAAAVTKALKEAKTADEANAALKAYNELSDTQKKLVATADVQAAQKVAADQALIEAQDEAALAKVKGKTVKAKAKKKTTAKLTVVTSKSGAKSTFKKASGNAKITVSKAGKVTAKKGLKAGKTYTAKVKATVGTQSKTIKVTVKVSK